MKLFGANTVQAARVAGITLAVAMMTTLAGCMGGGYHF